MTAIRATTATLHVIAKLLDMATAGLPQRSSHPHTLVEPTTSGHPLAETRFLEHRAELSTHAHLRPWDLEAADLVLRLRVEISLLVGIGTAILSSIDETDDHLPIG
jgi:hypothetical protein